MNVGRTQPDARAAGGQRPPDQDAGSSNLLAEMSGGSAGEPVVLLKPRRRIKIQNVMVAAVIVLSVVALYAMRLYGMGSGISFETVPIDYHLDGATGRLTPEQRRILSDLQASTGPIRIAAAQIDKNPFRLDDVKVLTPGTVTTPRITPSDPDADREVQAAQVLSRLELNGTMQGRIPIARISGKIYKVGDLIDGTFILKNVADRSVELEAAGKAWTLSIGEPDNRNP